MQPLYGQSGDTDWCTLSAGDPAGATEDAQQRPQLPAQVKHVIGNIGAAQLTHAWQHSDLRGQLAARCHYCFTS
jgi:hypothetical protein